MKKNGYTLVQLLIIIGVVALLVVAFFPISKYFKAKKNEQSFYEQAEILFKAAKKEYSKIVGTTNEEKKDEKNNEKNKEKSDEKNEEKDDETAYDGEIVYFDSKDKKRLLKSNAVGVNYYIGLNRTGDIVYFVVYNDNYKIEIGALNSDKVISFSSIGLSTSNKKYKIAAAASDSISLVKKVYDGMDIRLNRTNSYDGYLLGDVNRDKRITEEDAQLINNFVVGTDKLDDDQKVIADVTKDEKVNSKDSQQISKYIQGETSVYDSYAYSDIKRDGSEITLSMYNTYEGYLIGDINKDGKLTEEDVNIIKDYYNKKIEFDEIEKLLADVDKNEKIDDEDALIIKRYIDGNNSLYDKYAILDVEDVDNFIHDGTYVVRLNDISYNKYLLGDVNKDNRLTPDDNALINNYIKNKKGLNNEQIKLADVDKNGKVEPADVIQINRYNVGRSSVYDTYIMEKGAIKTGPEYEGPKCKFTKGKSIVDDGITVDIECINNGYGCNIVEGDKEMFVTGSAAIKVVDKGVYSDVCKIDVETYYDCKETEELWVSNGQYVADKNISSDEEFKKVKCYQNEKKGKWICKEYIKNPSCTYTYYFK